MSNPEIVHSPRYQKLSLNARKVYVTLLQKYQVGVTSGECKDEPMNYYARIYASRYGPPKFGDCVDMPTVVTAPEVKIEQLSWRHPVCHGDTSEHTSRYFNSKDERGGYRKSLEKQEFNCLPENLSAMCESSEEIGDNVHEQADLFDASESVCEYLSCVTDGSSEGKHAVLRANNSKRFTVNNPEVTNSSTNENPDAGYELLRHTEESLGKDQYVSVERHALIEKKLGSTAKHGKHPKCFRVPFKTKELQCSNSSKKKLLQTTVSSCFKDVKQGLNAYSCSEQKDLGKTTQTDIVVDSSTNLKELEAVLKQADDVVFTLTYSDASTQLREPLANGNKRKIEEATVKSLNFVIYCADSEPQVELKRVFSLDLESEQNKGIKWNVLTLLMSSLSPKICFDAQEMISVLLEFFGSQCRRGCSKWILEDPKLALWLIYPDEPPSTFAQTVKLSNVVHCGNLPPSESSWDDLMTLARVMKSARLQLKNANLWDLFINIESKLIPLLSVLEDTPLQVDMAKLKEFGSVLHKKLCRLEAQAHEAAGQYFVLTSTQQLRQVLFEVLKLDSKLPASSKMTRTASGNHKSTCESVLKMLAKYHPLPDIVLQHRQLQKLKSTYVDGLSTHVTHNQLFTHWDQISAATGRLTSTNPNIQTIPKTSVEVTDYEQNFVIGKASEPYTIHVRDVFIARTGWSFISADFCQIELRLLAHFSEDTALLKIFQDVRNTDIFVELTATWLDKPVGAVGDDDRERTKRVVYSIMYGAGKKTLAEYLDVKHEDANAIMRSFLKKFPGVNKFTSQCISACQVQGFVCTLFNRHRLFPLIKSHSYQLRTQSERQAVNFCIQGSAADLCKSAMLQINDLLLKKCLDARLAVQIHDELLFESPDDQLTVVCDSVKQVMENAEDLCRHTRLKVPLKVVVRTGKSWADMKEI